MQDIRDLISFSCVGYTLCFVFRIFNNQRSDTELESSPCARVSWIGLLCLGISVFTVVYIKLEDEMPSRPL